MRPSPLPKYHQISELLRQKIASGVFNIGSQLPTETTLCKEYQVSRGTIRKAYDMLENDGLIRREQGSGIFVAEPSPTPNQFSLIESRILKTEILAQELIMPNKELSEKLAISINTPVIHLVQLQYENEQALIYEERYLSAKLCPDLINDDLVTDSIHSVLIEKYGLSLVKLTHTIDIRTVNEEIAQLFDLKNSEKAFFVDRLSFTSKDDDVIPAVWYQAIYRRDDFRFQAAFQASI